MRLYKGRILRSAMKREMGLSSETRDALVYDVTPATRTARVIIQGTAQLVTVHYPENWMAAPHWLKVGNAVTLQHVGGTRGRLELSADGAVMPSVVSGGVTPPSPTYDDAIVSGYSMVAPVGTYLAVLVRLGTVRFNNISYVNEVDDVSAYVAGMGYTVSEFTAVKTLATAPATPGTARYDLITIDSNRDINVTQGTAASNPVVPTTPGGELVVGTVLVIAGATKIYASDFNNTYYPPVLTSLTISASDEDLAWGETTSSITVTAKDQYGNDIAGPWSFTLAFATGDGSFDSNPKTGSSSATFTYTRGTSSPHITASISGYYVSASVFIILRDEAGEVLL